LLPPFVKLNGRGGVIRDLADALELDIVSAMLQYWEGQKRRIIDALEERVPDDRKGVQLTMPFWRQEAKNLLAILLPLIQRGAENGVTAHEVAFTQATNISLDWTLAHTDAADWARRYCGELVKGVEDTTSRRVAAQVSNWIETQDRTFPDLVSAIAKDPAFNEKRARLIAATESTRAHAEGEMTAAETAEAEGYVEYIKRWDTARDDRVCEICGPLDNQEVIGARATFDTLVGPLEGPPAHPNCRCGLGMIPRLPK